jgi:esterase/lipase superfamily enzyme
MIIVVSNRDINEHATDHTAFGENANAKGLDEIRLAIAAYNAASRTWALSMVPESATGLTADNRPSQHLFRQIIQDIQAGKRKKNWVFYIHGFNQSFLESLTACHRIQTLYDVDVITFSWPSNPGGFVLDEYKRARQAARASSNALDRTLELLGHYLANRPLEEIQNCQISFNLLIHSLGNFLVENFVRDPIFSNETRIFDNVIFHQADVDNSDHKRWIDRIKHGRRIYITHNESDSVLKASDMINPGRLGNTLTGLQAQRAIYLDLTNGENVGSSHNFFDGQIENSIIQALFTRLLNGQRGEDVQGLTYDARANVFRL